MTTTTQPTAEAGRRILFTGYGGIDRAFPGVITAVAPDGDLTIRLDGSRTTLRITPATLPASKSLELLGEIGPVSELPMGRFQPGLQHPGMDCAYDGVLVLEFDEGDLAAITDDRGKAEAAIATHLRERLGMDDESSISDELKALKPQWAAFEWQPEEAEHVWWWESAEEGDDQAIRIHYLPA